MSLSGRCETSFRNLTEFEGLDETLSPKANLDWAAGRGDDSERGRVTDKWPAAAKLQSIVHDPD